MTEIERAPERERPGCLPMAIGIVLLVFVIGLAWALVWQVLGFIFGTIALGARIGVFLLIVLGLLVLVGMFRTHVIKR